MILCGVALPSLAEIHHKSLLNSRNYRHPWLRREAVIKEERHSSVLGVYLSGDEEFPKQVMLGLLSAPLGGKPAKSLMMVSGQQKNIRGGRCAQTANGGRWATRPHALVAAVVAASPPALSTNVCLRFPSRYRARSVVQASGRSKTP